MSVPKKTTWDDVGVSTMWLVSIMTGQSHATSDRVEWRSSRPHSCYQPLPIQLDGSYLGGIEIELWLIQIGWMSDVSDAISCDQRERAEAQWQLWPSLDHWTRPRTASPQHRTTDIIHGSRGTQVASSR